jgi:hypothetical protein
MKIQISVTQEDIKHGIRKAQLSCPIARAVRRHLPNLKVFGQVCVGDKNVGFYKPNESTATTIVTLPKKASKFVRDFDRLRDVKPFNFSLDIPIA